MVTDRLWRTSTALLEGGIPLRNAEPSDAEAFSHITEHRHLLDSEAFSHIMEHRRLLLAARLTCQTHPHILEGPKSPDIIFLQEITPDVQASLLDDTRVRAAGD